LTVQQNCFSDLYPANILDLSAKLFFPHGSESWNTESRDIKLGIRISGIHRIFLFLNFDSRYLFAIYDFNLNLINSSYDEIESRFDLTENEQIEQLQQRKMDIYLK